MRFTLAVLLLLSATLAAQSDPILRMQARVYAADGTLHSTFTFDLQTGIVQCGQERPRGVAVNPKRIFFKDPNQPASGFYCIWQEGPSGPIAILPAGEYAMTLAAVTATKASFETAKVPFTMSTEDGSEDVPVPEDFGLVR